MRPLRLHLAEYRRLGGRCLVPLMLVALILGCLAGCGKKADPLPLRHALPSVISDLRAEKKEQGIELRFSMVLAEGRFKVLRSEQFPDEEICVDCPRHYVVVQESAIGDPQLRYENANRTWSWIDRTVKVENSYFYRIVVCDASGFCSEPSNIAAVLKKQPGEVKEK